MIKGSSTEILDFLKDRCEGMCKDTDECEERTIAQKFHSVRVRAVQGNLLFWHGFTANDSKGGHLYLSRKAMFFKEPG